MRYFIGFLLYFVLGLGIAIGLELLTPNYAFAQGGDALGAVSISVSLFFSIIFYIFFSFSIQTIANKLSIENSWLAWIPLANLWLWVKIAGRPSWWVLLLFIPFVNFIVSLIMLFDIPPRVNKPSILALVVLVPLLGVFIYFGILAFT